MMRIVVGAAVLAALCPFSARAQPPEEEKKLTLRLEGGFTAPLGAPLVVDATGNSPTGGALTFPFDSRTEGNLRLGVDLPGGFTPMVGIGLGVVGVSNSTTSDTGVKVETSQTVYSAVLSLQVRYYTSRHGPGLKPFVWAEFDKSFLWGSASETGPNSDSKAAQKQLDLSLRGLNPLGLLGGFGAEYGFSGGFGIGGRWGLGWFKTTRNSNPTELGPGVTADSRSVFFVASQADLYAAFRF